MTHGMVIEPVDVSEIIVSDRHRKDMGDLQGLADSIRQLGLLQPIGITKDKRLVFGERRLRAWRDVLGRDTIQARIVDVPRIVDGEYHENEMRKDFTPSERVEIAKAVKAEMGDRRGVNQHTKEHVDNCPHAPLSSTPTRTTTRTDGEKTRAIAAEKAGFSSEIQFRRAKAVVEKGIPELVEAMDEGEVSISRARDIAMLPTDQQQPALKAEIEKPKRQSPCAADGEIKELGVGVIRANEAINCLTRIPKDDPLRKRGLQIVSDWIRHNK